MAPELEGGGRIEEVTPAVDVYSLGKMLYAIVAGSEVFPREKHDEQRWDLRVRWPEDFAIHHLAAVVRATVRERALDRPTMDEVVSMLDRALANVRAGVRYSEGMYEDGGTSAEERAFQLRKKLVASDRTNRRALLVQVTEDTEQRIKDSIQSATPRSVSAPFGQPYKELLPIASAAADEMLALTSPLLEIGDEERFSECLSRLTRVLRLDDGREYDPARMSHIAGAVAASVIVGAIAWRSRQAGALACVVKRYADLPYDFSHLKMLGGGSGLTGPWIASLARESRVLSSMDRPVNEVQLARALAAVHGLAALRWCGTHVTAERLAELGAADPELLDIGVPGFPALYFFADPPWLHELGATFADEPSFAEEVAQAVMGMTAEGLRDVGRRATPALLRTGGRLAHEQDRIFSVRAVSGLAEWDAWTGRQVG